ncbi:MAG: hypothetical protein JRD19_04170 [Deltaproteobacteria bacterium]|jgi:hypothetical protein|nr:hypothetical protein [Deltaproteobacteria bacterium]
MNTYIATLTNDINKVQDLSHVCRGEWCRFLESEVDSLQYELQEFQNAEGDFERTKIEEMSARLRDAYKHLATDIHI